MISNEEIKIGEFGDILEETLHSRSKLKKPNLMNTSSEENPLDLFACVVCGGLLRNPVNIPCGYSACKLCIKKLSETESCPKCDKNHFNSLKTKPNVLLYSVLQKWFPECYLDSRFNEDLYCENSNKDYSNLSPPKKELIDPGDFQCTLCSDLLYEPVSTNCGHVFCLNCIQRSLDYRNKCPLCNESIIMMIDLSSDIVTAEVIKKFLPNAYSQRKAVIDEEIKTIKSHYPVFPCTLPFPSVSCPLHIFEPRYRLLIRRALKYFDRTFGMCMKLETQSPEAVGTILNITSVRYMEDGRSILDTVGTKRFIPDNSLQFDGYNTSNISIITDKPVSSEEEANEITLLTDQIYELSTQWFASIPDDVRNRILNFYGYFPSKVTTINIENGPDWHWWMFNILPICNEVKAKMLRSDSLKDRLLEIQGIITHLNLTAFH